MTTFEEKVNAYRENKRLMEELEAMNDAVKAENHRHDARCVGDGTRHRKGHLQRCFFRPAR